MSKLKINKPRLVGEVTSGCLRYPTDSKWNWVYSRANMLDWPDQVASFILDKIPTYFSDHKSWESFVEDMFKNETSWYKPWYRFSRYSPEYMEPAPKILDWIMLATDENWRYIKDKEWFLMYKLWYDGEELYNWNNLPTEKKRNFLFFQKTVYKDRMVHFPDWYNNAKQLVIDATKNLAITTALPKETIEAMENWIIKFFERAESWDASEDWRKKLYGLFSRDGTNFFKLMMIAYPNGNRVLTERKFAQEFFWFWLDFSNTKAWEKAWANLQNAMYLSLWQGRWLNANIFDTLPLEVREKVYWEMMPKLYQEKWWKIIELDEPEDWLITASYLNKLNSTQLHNQVKTVMNKIWMPFNAWKAYAKIYLWSYPMSWAIKMLKTFGSPQILSAFMSFASGLSGLLPLLSLNMGMWIMQTWMSRKKIFTWDFNRFLNKYWFLSEIPYDLWNESSLSMLWIHAAHAVSDAFNGGLYNIWDMLTSWTYRQRQLALFFKSQFPWVTSVEELDRQFSKLSTVERDAFLNAARKYAEHSTINLSSNRTFRHSGLHLHTADNEWTQPWVDAFYLMSSFFSSFWYNKANGTLNILKEGFENVFKWRIWANYLDNLLDSWMDPDDARALASKVFLQNQDFAYTLDKFYRSFILWKYRAQYWAREDWRDLSVKELFSSLFNFAEYFEGTIAAAKTLIFIWSLWAAIDAWSTAYEVESQDGIDWNDAKSITKTSTFKLIEEFSRRFTRRLYAFKILANTAWNLTENQEVSLWEALISAIQDTTTWYMYYMDDSLDKDGFEKNSITAWPIALIERYMGKSNEEKEFITWLQSYTKYKEWLKKLSKIVNNIFSWNSPEEADVSWFWNWVKYRIPVVKDYYRWKIIEENPIADALHEYQKSDIYRNLEKWILPSNLTDRDYYYIYWLATKASIQNVEKYNRNTGKRDNTFINDDWKKVLNRRAEFADNIDMTYFKEFMSDEAYKKFETLQLYLAEERADSMRRASYMDPLVKDWQTYDPIYKKSDLEIARTLAFIEKDSPWVWRVALSYLLSQEAKNIRYPEWSTYKKLSKEEVSILRMRASVEAARKYGKYIFDVDNYEAVPQLWMYFAKTRWFEIGKYISDPWDSLKKSLKFVKEDWTPISRLKKLYELDMWNNIIATKHDLDVSKIASLYQEWMNVNHFIKEDWTIDPEDKKFLLNAFSASLKNIKWLPVDDNIKNQIKVWMLLTIDPIFNDVKEDPRFKDDKTTQELLKDVAYFWHGTTWELANIVEEKAEDEAINTIIKWVTKRAEATIRENEWEERKKNRKSYSGLFDLDREWSWFYSWKNKMFSWFNKIYPYIRDRYYSHYFKYYDLDHKVNTKPVDYLMESEFQKAVSRSSTYKHNVKKEEPRPSKPNKDSGGVWGMSQRGKAMPFVKEEDPYKNVEYKVPYRKRWVRRWSWFKPISPATWKRLTPTPPKWKKK